MTTKMKTLLTIAMLLLALPSAKAAVYRFDTKNALASLTFKVSHIDIGFIVGRFDRFHGNFSYDHDNPASSSLSVTVNTASIDTNYQALDNQLRSAAYLNVKQYPIATFTSTHIDDLGDDMLSITGTLTLNGISRPLVIEAVKTGEGDDHQGNHRLGFSAHTQLDMNNFGIHQHLGTVTLSIAVEGVGQPH